MLEGALVPSKKKAKKTYMKGLNPYCAGRCSRALSWKEEMGTGGVVLILIVLEGALVQDKN